MYGIVTSCMGSHGTPRQLLHLPISGSAQVGCRNLGECQAERKRRSGLNLFARYYRAPALISKGGWQLDLGVVPPAGGVAGGHVNQQPTGERNRVSGAVRSAEGDDVCRAIALRGQ